MPFKKRAFLRNMVEVDGVQYQQELYNAYLLQYWKLAGESRKAGKRKALQHVVLDQASLDADKYEFRQLHELTLSTIRDEA